MILAEYAVPTPGSASSSVDVAVLRSTSGLGSGLAFASVVGLASAAGLASVLGSIFGAGALVWASPACGAISSERASASPPAICLSDMSISQRARMADADYHGDGPRI